MSSVVDTSLPDTFASDAASAAAAKLKSTSKPSRPDGRAATELRPIAVEHSLLTRSDGSTLWSVGGTSILVGITGPSVAGPMREERYDRAHLSVNFKAEAGMATNLDIERGSYIRQVFEPIILLSSHPRCRIQINLQVIRDSGSVLAAAINATTLALIDAGIATTAIVAAVCIATKEIERDVNGSKEADGNETTDFLLDPTSEEVDTSMATTTFAFASTTPGAILSLFESGSLDSSIYFNCLAMARAACAHVQQFMKMSLERKLAQPNTKPTLSAAESEPTTQMEDVKQ